MHLASQTALLVAREVQEHRDYFYNTHIRPFCEPSSVRKGKRAKGQAGKHSSQKVKNKNYVNGQDVEIPFTVSHENQEDYLHRLDPTQWRDQDHYLVLGLGHRRYQATDDEIKKAYKRLILKHHPDKRRQKGEAVQDETKDYFACINKANDILGDPEKRRAFDSIDAVVAAVADDVPDKLKPEERQEFFELFAPVFRWNARWSVKQPVPQLGDNDAMEEYTDEFYEFWYNFDSWREYSYLDEPVTGDDRYERRAMEKQNKDVRKERKGKEMGRLRRLVDNAFASDPRIVKFKDEEKQRKEAEKQARKDAQRARQEAEEQQRRETIEKEQEERRQQEESAKAEAEKAKKEKEAEKKVLKKERKTLRDLMKGWNYFADNSGTAKNMQETEKLCDILTAQQLQDLNERFAAASLEDARGIFVDQVDEINKKLEAERAAAIKEKEDKEKLASAQKEQEMDQRWNEEELKLLIKAVNLYPAGTGNRWEVVAEYINHHMFIGGITTETERQKKTAKDVIAKSKTLKRIDQCHDTMRAEVNKKAFDSFAGTQKTVVKPAKDDGTITERFDRDTVNGSADAPKPWSAAEQKLLEQALKKFPASDPARWDNIAKELQTRSKQECVKRYKELVEKIKAQKAAAAAAK
ncbi:dnaJ homolog subfamily C member 2-like [Paramacrobiotus metropolitanus]|uniref:dnaJ homolog subfamily C member 2-like n=1 Tax=Paramacrobiotus metropolitanus TaxID=2943436 RepID=UPI0024463C9F|nr:dnaJ homolog subfamily C member 2-like [Paramacrobiotus metropolitanus]